LSLNTLLKPFQEELKLLWNAFKEVRRKKQKTSWRAEKGHYCLCLYVDNIKFELSH